MDVVAEGLPELDEEKYDEEEIRLAVIGRPNVGKSSLVNRLIGDDVQIVSDIPGTTRDAIDHKLKYMKRQITLVDTAGLRRKNEMKKVSVEYYTMLRTIKALDRASVAAVLIDAEDGLTQYERRLFDEVRQKGKGLIAVVNKWDLIEKETNTQADYEKDFRDKLPRSFFYPDDIHVCSHGTSSA